MSVSERKMSVVATRNLPGVSTNGKLWVAVKFASPKGWVPSFKDIWRIVRAICHCEDEKYPDGKGRKMVAEFLQDCVYEPNWQALESKYAIPNRDAQPAAAQPDPPDRDRVATMPQESEIPW